MNYVLFGFFLFGIFITIMSILSMLSKRNILKTGKHTTGTICKFKEFNTYSRTLKKRTTYYPYVEFRTESDIITAKYNVNCSIMDEPFHTICKYKVSDKVNVVYNPKNPKKFVIDEPQMIYREDAAMIIVGITFAITPFIFYFMELYR